ncbi:hydrolase [Catellatospora sp. TT07R-123]|uniref:HAD family hydrolase n=1 Tax=Catellatospora sp. TT07R-123 TaxID=2733863 RepID=UPI001B166BA3|nr:HAD family hydrolase [Catellatospora sp. TT07R-123]GHJ46735.1 hydrolase [Catellatospora sp. TT07R-123]
MLRQGLPKLVATDLDGTVVRSDATVSGFTHSVFERVRAAGVPIVGATGRGPRLEELSRIDLPHADLLVLGGGGRVLDLREPGLPRVLRDARLPGTTLAALVDALEQRLGPVKLLVEALDTPNSPIWGDDVTDWPYPDDVRVQPRAESLGHDIIKAFVRVGGDDDSDTLLRTARALVPAETAAFTHSGLGWVEITPPNVDKASGLAVVAEELGVDPADVLVFGDMPNDIPMFEWAGRRVAVANAHPEVIALADETTLSNDRDGVAVYLDGLLRRSR